MLTDHARKVLQGRYTVGDEKPEDIFKRVADYYGTDLDHCKRLLEYFEKMWAIPASPILANGGTDRALPISCYLSYVPDSRQGISDHFDEVIWMGTSGGGIGAHWNDIRSAGQKTSRGTVTTGYIQFSHVADSLTLACNQGAARQASYSSWIRIDHPEIMEHLGMRTPSGGDVHRKNLNLHSGVSITDDFMEKVLNDEPFDLVDPKSKQVCRTVSARELWQQLVETRLLTGEPMIANIDEINRKLHPDLKNQGLKVHGSNLCSEITLPTDEERTAVCCLSSLNLEKFDEWEGNYQFIRDMLEFLDNVLSDFIKKAPPELKKAAYSAAQERSVGLGTMGWHAYLQKHSIPIETPAAIGTNIRIFSYIYECAKRANKELAELRGPALGLQEDRFAHMIAIAPNASTGIIAGTSPSIEPWNTNYFLQPTVSGALPMKNKYLKEVLQALGKDTDEVWMSILSNKGSVQHLDFLSDWDKAVFKTWAEINQLSLIKLAGDRQKYICQSQSVNLFFPSGADIKYINKVHIEAWKQKLKTLYYVRTAPVRTAGLVSECVACEG